MKIISLVLVLLSIILSQSRVVRTSSLKASSYSQKKRLSKTRGALDLTTLSESNQVQVLLGIFEQLGRQFKLQAVVVKDLYDKYRAKITECFLRDWKGDLQTQFDQLNTSVNEAKSVITQKVPEPKRLKKDNQVQQQQQDSDSSSESRKSKRAKKFWPFPEDPEAEKKIKEAQKARAELEKKEQADLDKANTLLNDPLNIGWVVKLKSAIDKTSKILEKIWGTIKQSLDCIKFIVEKIAQIVGANLNFIDQILDVFGTVVNFVITFTVPVVRWIQKAYLAFQLFLTVNDVYALWNSFPNWKLADFNKFGAKITDFIFKIKDLLNPIGRKNNRLALIHKAQRRLARGKSVYRYKKIDGVKTLVLY